MAKEISEIFTTPVGRLVQGDCFVASDKAHDGSTRVFKSGPKIGQPNPQFFVAVAFAKSFATLDDEMRAGTPFGQCYAVLDRVARASWPSLFPNPAGPCVDPSFAMKVKDGDGRARNGTLLSEKEGFAGHWIVSFASQFAPECSQPVNGARHKLTDPGSIRRGYYIRIAGNAQGNGSVQTPGIFVNVSLVELAGFGPEISSGPDAASAFAAPAALPAGASAVPTMPPAGTTTAPPAPYVAPTPAPYVAPTPTPAPYVAPTPAPPPAPVAPPPAPVTPNTTYMAPPPAPAFVMTVAANGLTREAYLASGWTDDQLIAGGMMTRA